MEWKRGELSVSKVGFNGNWVERGWDQWFRDHWAGRISASVGLFVILWVVWLRLGLWFLYIIWRFKNETDIYKKMRMLSGEAGW